MRGFWKRRRSQLDRRPTVFWQGVRGTAERFQRKAAVYLERKTAYWDRRSKLIALFLFCLLFGGLSLWLLARALFIFNH
jgi:hypothetical protein